MTSQSQQGGGVARDLKQGTFIEASVQGGDNEGREQKAAKWQKCWGALRVRDGQELAAGCKSWEEVQRGCSQQLRLSPG